MHLLRFRPVTRTVRLELPDGSTRPVKVTVNDTHSTQHVEDGDRVHGTARPPSVRVEMRRPARSSRYGGLLRNLGGPKIRQGFSPDVDTGLWAPVPGATRLR